MQFRSSTSQVQHLELQVLENFGNQSHLIRCHHFGAPWPGIHVAMAAALIAAVAKVDLQGLQLTSEQRRKSLLALTGGAGERWAQVTVRGCRHCG